MVGIGSQAIAKKSIARTDTINQFFYSQEVQDAIDGHPVEGLGSAQRLKDILGAEGTRAVSNNFQNPQSVLHAVQIVTYKETFVITLMSHNRFPP